MDTTGAGRAAGKRWRIGSGLAIAAVAVAGLVPLVGAEAHRGAAHGAAAAPSDKVLLFAADGMRQDAVEKYAAQGRMPGMRELLRRGAKASGNGLLTQAPPNTGAGWNTLASGAWPGVTGTTNNTFHISCTDFTRSTSGLAPGVLQAETIAQSAERDGKKVAQIEWAGGR
ncbi:MAG: alkaline phosphatase family protein, partial [Solirubrobacteraceae bacterium]